MCYSEGDEYQKRKGLGGMFVSDPSVSRCPLCEGRLHGEKRVILPRPSPAYLRTISQIRGPRNWTGGKYVKLAAAPLPQRKDGVKEARRGEARETQIVKRQGPDPGADKVVDPEEERMADRPSDELMWSHG